MTRHAEILNSFKTRFDIDPPPDIDQDLTYLKMILIKACDVSNEIRPPAVAEPWVERLLQEYFLQVMFFIGAIPLQPRPCQICPNTVFAPLIATLE